MADCFQPWVDNFNACTAATGGLGIPTEPNADNVDVRKTICATPACQKLFTVFRSLIDTKCPAALEEVRKYPNGMYTQTFCPRVTPPSTPPPPTTRPPTSPPTTKPPPTTAPLTSTTTAPPPPTTTADVSPTRTTPGPVTTPPAPTDTTNTTTAAPTTTSPTSGSSLSGSPTLAPDVSTATPAQASATAAPTTAITASKTGVSSSTIAAAGGGGFVILVLVIIIVLLVRRRRSSTKSEHEGTERKVGEDRDPEAAYTNYSTAPTEDTYTKSGLLDGGLVLAGKRIPFNALQFGEVISQGGFGEVVKGTYNDEVVAIKRLLAARRKDRDNLHSFFQEIKLTSTLQHDCLVRFVGYAWDAPANLCMISEFMPCGDLRTLMVKYEKRGHANGHDDAKLRILEQVACALQYLHGLNPPVVHRDLKSRNILLSAKGDAKLIDFGISCERQDYTMTAGVGTRLWMAPEVMMGERYDETADVFSFGVILSELDTHALPYDDARDTNSDRKLTDVKLTQLISMGRIYPRFTSRADPSVVALARDCLQLVPARRPSSAEVVSRLARIRHHDTTATRSGVDTQPWDTRTAASRAISQDSALSYGTRASTRRTARY